jgi:hypothetical protein
MPALDHTAYGADNTPGHTIFISAYEPDQRQRPAPTEVPQTPAVTRAAGLQPLVQASAARQRQQDGAEFVGQLLDAIGKPAAGGGTATQQQRARDWATDPAAVAIGRRVI